MKTSLRRRLALGATVVGAVATGYGRVAVAGNCTGMGGVYSCSGGAGPDMTQVLPTMGAPALSVTTQAGFGITTLIGNAFTLSGTGGLTFADSNLSAITGAAGGIYANNVTSGNLTIVTSGTVTGTVGSGIDAQDSGTGSIEIITAGVIARFGITANNSGGGDVMIDSRGGMVTATNGGGIYAENSATSGSLTITTAEVRGFLGIQTRNDGSGATMIDTRGGQVIGTDPFGITAQDFGAGLISIITADVSGGARGIDAYNRISGDLTIDSSLGAVAGIMAEGLFAIDNGSGSISITTATVSGGSRGIDARNSGGGNLEINISGEVVGGSGEALFAQQTGAGVFTVTNSGTLLRSLPSAAALALTLVSNGDGATLTNQGTGRIIGRLNLTTMDDSFDNSGQWLVTGAPDFGGGLDALHNRSSGVIVSAFGAAAEITRFDNLEVLRNAGVISLLDNGLGDRLEIAAAFQGEAGSAIGLDVFLDDGTVGADMLVISGAASGVTWIGLNVIGGAGAETGSGPGMGIAVIDASAGTTTAGNFALLGGRVAAGLFQYNLVLESDGIWYLQSDLLDQLDAYAYMPTAVVNQLRFVNDLLGAHLEDLRHLYPDGGQTSTAQTASLGLADLAEGSQAPASSGLSLWLEAGASGGDYEPSGAAAFRQDNQGFALGGDLLLTNILADDRLFLGAMAGYSLSDGGQNNGVNFNITAWSLGLYAVYLLENETATPFDGLRLDGRFTASLLDIGVEASLPAVQVNYAAATWSASFGAAYGFEVAKGLILEPKVGLFYQTLRQDDFTDGLAIEVSLDEGQSLEGELGLRVQKHWDLSGLGLVAPYVEASLLHEFEGANRVTANGVDFTSSVEGTRYQLGLGLDAQVGRDLSVFGGLELTWGEHLDQSVQALAGGRLAF